MILKPSVHQNHLEGKLKQIIVSAPRVSDPVGPGSCLRILISNKFSSDADDGGITLGKTHLSLKELLGCDENLFGIMRKELDVE